MDCRRILCVDDEPCDPEAQPEAVISEFLDNKGGAA